LRSAGFRRPKGWLKWFSGYKEDMTSLPRQLFKANIHRAFIAYSYVYVEEAIKAQEHSLTAEAVVIQPYRKDMFFTSTKEATHLYRTLKDGQHIPILFTPQHRWDEKGQFFEYGTRLLDVLDITNARTEETVKRNRQLGKWVLQYGDDLYTPKNVLVVRAPIVPLPEKLPVEVAFNILRPHSGGRTQAVSIPAPKLIDEKYAEVLQAL
jgi:hypothetical protein